MSKLYEKVLFDFDDFVPVVWCIVEISKTWYSKDVA